MTDYVDERCPFCRGYLTDLDGVYECQEGCGAYESIQTNGSIIWNTATRPFTCIEECRADMGLYNNQGQLISGEKKLMLGVA